MLIELRERLRLFFLPLDSQKLFLLTNLVFERFLFILERLPERLFMPLGVLESLSDLRLQRRTLGGERLFILSSQLFVASLRQQGQVLFFLKRLCQKGGSGFFHLSIQI